MIRLEQGRVPRTVRVTFADTLTVENARETRSVLARALEETDRIGIAFRSVRGVDLAFLQVWTAFVREAGVRRVQLRIPKRLPSALRRTADACGMDPAGSGPSGGCHA
jgi:hypothetical protein